MKLKMRWPVLGLVLLMLFWIVEEATADTFAARDVYRVPAEATVEEDLLIVATEIIVDGTVQGDLYVLGSFVEINGVVTGDVVGMSGGMVINGRVEDDVRIATGGLLIEGQIDGSLAAISGGSPSFAMPLQLGTREIQQGVLLQPAASVGEDVLLSGGYASLAGDIGEDVTADLTGLRLASQIGGDAKLELVDFELSDTAVIAGKLTYTAPQPVIIDPSTTATVQFNRLNIDSAALLVQGFIQLISTVLGFIIVGWLLLRYAPSYLLEPVALIQAQPLLNMWVGFIVGTLFLFFPLATFFLALGAGIFWGSVTAVLLAAFIFTAFVLLWIFSPLLISLWVGQRFATHPLTALIIGLLVVIPLTQFPLLGLAVSLFCFTMALGSLLLWRKSQPLPSLQP